MTKLLIELNINKNLKEKINTKLNIKKIDPEIYILDLINKDINSKLYIEEGYYFDYEKNKLFQEDKEILLTKNQYKIFKYLLDNQNSLVSCEELENIIKTFTKDSIRNFVMQLRRKTYRHLIKTSNGNGYTMVLI